MLKLLYNHFVSGLKSSMFLINNSALSALSQLFSEISHHSLEWTQTRDGERRTALVAMRKKAA